ncbi:MAG: type IV pilin N-terminal domain-containing protein [Methanoregula sp.]|nr:type IV pilin N-terminal domain-containing protein [Methanoregula sp.]
MRQRQEHAVSPVVGVMLMLVVTIIIAALVSAFAGGMAKTSDKAPQATIQGTFSQANGLTLFHNGGDTLTTKDLVITLTASNEFGEGMDRTAVVLNKTMITDLNGNPWLNITDGTIGVTAFTPGSTMVVNLTNLKAIGSASGAGRMFQSAVGSGTANAQWWTTSLLNPANVGKNIILEVDTTKGQMISKTKIPVKP